MSTASIEVMGNLALVPSDIDQQISADKTACDMVALMQAVAEQRSREAFLKIFRHYAPPVKAFLINRGLSHAAADDVLQEVMLGVWQKAASYNSGKAGVSTWIFTIARYKYIDRLRHEGRRPTESADFDLREAENMLSDDEVLQEQRQDSVQLAIAKLPANQQSVIFLSFIKGLAHIEIAEQLGIPLGTVKSRIRRSFAQLREELVDLKLV
jgi:RNA polymerase sigma-70 factor (ECF subfamily)